MKKRFLATLLCLCMVLTLLPGTAFAATVGPFEVDGGTLGTDYEYSNATVGWGALAIKTGTALTISMATAGASTTTNEGRIVIADGVTANLTLSGVEIGWDNVGPRSALTLGAGSTLNLTIEGNNSLAGSSDACGIRVPTGATLYIAGSGTLSATGTGQGAGIGGGGIEVAGYHLNCGSVIINGGTVTATGGNGGAAGIGGGGGISQAGGDGGSITINGGTVTATGGTGIGGSSIGAGIGGGGGYGGNGGDGATVVITGGNVYATGCQGNSGTGGSIGGGMWTDDSGRTFSPGAPGTVKNSSANVYLTTLTLDGAGDVPVGGFTTKPAYFGMTGVRTLSSKLYFYLPENTAVSAVQTGGTSPQEYQSATAIQTNASGTAAGTLTLPTVPTVTGVTISPAVASVGRGGTQQFTATVTGPNSPSQDVAWTIRGNSSANTRISATGLLIVGSDETEGGYVLVTATSTADPSKSDTVNVAIHSAEPGPGPAPAAPAAPTYTVYNDENIPDAKIWVTGAGLQSGDLLITERMRSGSLYDYMLSLAGTGTTHRVYDISLRSGSRGGYPMYIYFDLGSEYEGQVFTLMHRKSDGTVESFTAMADPQGVVRFGPLSELSPFSIVFGSAEIAEVSAFVARVPDTGDMPVWPAAMLAAAAAFAVGLVTHRSRRRE